MQVMENALEMERARQLLNDWHDELLPQNKVLNSKVKCLSEVDATRTQCQEHMENHVMKMCEFGCVYAQEFRQTLESQVQQQFQDHTSEFRTEFNAQTLRLPAKATTEVC